MNPAEAKSRMKPKWEIEITREEKKEDQEKTEYRFNKMKIFFVFLKGT